MNAENMRSEGRSVHVTVVARGWWYEWEWNGDLTLSTSLKDDTLQSLLEAGVGCLRDKSEGVEWHQTRGWERVGRLGSCFRTGGFGPALPMDDSPFEIMNVSVDLL